LPLSAPAQEDEQDFNTASGVSSLENNTTGWENTASGLRALFSNTEGNFNTAIGSQADVLFGNLTNATAIGWATLVTASNKIRVGSTFVTVIEGQVAFTASSDKTPEGKLPAGRWRGSAGKDSGLGAVELELHWPRS
jgi:hypothetical protein